MKKTVVLLFTLIITFMTFSCTVTQGPVRIGIKSFDEQRILANMIETLVEQEGKRTTIITCGDTYSCQKAIMNGDIDIMIEYTGTALTLSGLTVPADVDSMDKVRNYYSSLGLKWLVDLGFQNDYVVVVPAAMSAVQNIRAIPDLTQIDGDIKMAVPPSYVRRPGDGLHPLARRYGLTLDDEHLLISDPNARYRAVLNGRADAAVAFRTDGFLAGQQLRILADPESFFSPYYAGIVVREQALTTYKELESILKSLQNRIGTHTMRLMNEEVQLQARSVERVAAEYLQRQGLVKKTEKRRFGQPELYLVNQSDNQLRKFQTRALDMISRVFPDFAVRQETVYDPAETLAEGRARLALLGAEDFFSSANGLIVRREDRVEAVSVVGIRFAHIINRRDKRYTRPFQGRIGITSTGYRSSKAGSDILALAGVKPDMRGTPEELLSAVAKGKLDKAIIVSGVPDPVVARALSENPKLELRSIPENFLENTRSFNAPYLKIARIPVNSYPGQEELIDTLSTQVVLAAPAPKEGERVHIGGPASAIRAGGVSLTPEEAQSLLEAGFKGEMPDPVLPSPWSLRSDTDERKARIINKTTEIALSIFGIIYIIALGALLSNQLRLRRENQSN